MPNDTHTPGHVAEAEFVREVRALVALPHTDRAEATREALERAPGFAALLGELRAYAAHGDRHDDKERVDELIELVLEVPELKLPGRDSLRAFHLMVELGVWDKHENVWLHRYDVHTAFSPELIEEAERIADEPFTPEPWRRDLTYTSCVTIDDPYTRDLDDALSCQPLLEGGWEVGIHIADPGAFVPHGSPLDLEARRRGTSIYLPTGVVPMFPPALSEGAMSLEAGRTRPALSTIVRFDEWLEIESVEVVPTVVRVTTRMTYEEVQEILDDEHSRHRFAPALHDLSYLADELYQQRISQGGVNFNIPEGKVFVELEEDGKARVDVRAIDTSTPARTLVSEMMILCGMLMGEYCSERDIPVIYRRQDDPDGDLYDASILDLPEGLARTFGMLRKMKRGDISTYPSRHFALGLDAYVQASSPIRRYSDLLCQRQVLTHLRDEPAQHGPQEVLEIAATAEATGREASTVERETRRYRTQHMLQRQKGTHLDATVVAHLRGGSLLVFLNDLAIRARCSATRTPALGERVTVEVERSDPRRDLLRLRLV